MAMKSAKPTRLGMAKPPTMHSRCHLNTSGSAAVRQLVNFSQTPIRKVETTLKLHLNESSLMILNLLNYAGISAVRLVKRGGIQEHLLHVSHFGSIPGTHNLSHRAIGVVIFERERRFLRIASWFALTSRRIGTYRNWLHAARVQPPTEASPKANQSLGPAPTSSCPHVKAYPATPTPAKLPPEKKSRTPACARAHGHGESLRLVERRSTCKHAVHILHLGCVPAGQ